MKPLILILLGATYAAAQNPSLADFAREERARQREVQTKNADIQSIKVYTTEAIRTTPPADDAAAPAAAPGDASQAPTTAPAPAADAAPATATVDPVQQWFADNEKQREKIRELIDHEATDQLEINRISNEVYKPDTRESDRDRARTQLGQAQDRLAQTREQLATARLDLQKREHDGPPRK